MKQEITTLLLLLAILGCDNAQNKKNAAYESHFSNKNSTRSILLKNIWQEYKREDAAGRYDTVLCKNVSIQIGKTTFSYFISGELKYSDTLIVNDKYSYPVFNFKSKSGTKLYFLRKDSSELVLKHFENEGAYEYFRIEK